MQSRRLPLVTVLVLFLCASSELLSAQTSAGSTASVQQASVPNLIRFSGTLPGTDASLRIVGVTFALYRDQTGGSPLWLETQNVRVDASGHFSALLGSTKTDGIPSLLFTTNETRWIGVTPEGQKELPRVLLVSVPYAIKAGDAQTLGGLPASAFLQISTSGNGASIAPRITTASPKSLTGINGTTGTQNFVAKWIDSANLGNSIMFDNGAAVGINTTTPAATLDVNGSAVFRGFATLFSTTLNNGPIFRFTNKATPVAADWTLGIPGVANSTSMWIYDNVNKSAPFQIEQGAINHALYIRKNGSIGIGTASPATTLDVYGNAMFRAFGTYFASPINNGPIFRFTNKATPTAADWTFGVPGMANSTSMWIYDNVNKTAPFQIEQGAITNSFYITNTGNVGIGTTSPSTKLDVAGTVHTTGGIKFNDNTVQTTAGLTQTGGDGRYLQLTGGTLTGSLTATSFTGSGSGLTNVVNSLTAGTGVTATGSTGNVTVSLDSTYTDGRYAKLSGGNALVGNQAVTGAITATSTITSGGTVTGNAVNSATKYELAGNTILSTLGSGNVFVGIGVDPVNTSGHDNTMAGSTSGNSNTTGYSNSFYGSLSGYSNVDGYYNTFLGEGAGYSNTSAHENTFGGFVAGYSNTTGNGNTVLGSNAGYYNSTGNNNTYIGYVAGGGTNNTGSENIYIGHNTGSTAATESNTMRLGDSANITSAYMAGVFGTTVGSDGIAVVVDSNGQLGTIVSSRRFKQNIRPMADLSTGLLKLKPVAFYYKPEVDKSAHRLLQYGLIAEDVAKVYPDLVVYDKEGKPFTVKYQYLTPMLLNELEKQHAVIVAQEKEAESQREQLKSLQDRLERLERLVEEKER